MGSSATHLVFILLIASGASALQGPPAGTEPYRVGGDVSRPEKVSGENPRYTEMARRARVTGVVILEAVIDELGDVEDLKVLKGLPMGLDQAAVEAVETWKFLPALREGRPVKVYYTLTVNFQVEDGPAFGPAVREFLDGNPQFIGSLRAGRSDVARGALERWRAERPAVFELEALASFLLAAEGRFGEAWSAVAGFHGPERYDVLYNLGGLAWRWAATETASLTAERRAAFRELGLKATSEAMAARPEDALEAIEYKAMLLQDKARLLAGEGERRALEGEALELLKVARELRDRRKAAAAAPAE